MRVNLDNNDDDDLHVYEYQCRYVIFEHVRECGEIRRRKKR